MVRSNAELERARRLVLAWGWNSTAYQIINPGIALWFASRGDALAGYVSAGKVRVVAGAPVAAADALASVVQEFEADARRAGQRVCYFGAEERLDAICRPRPGYSFISLGAQPVWHPPVLCRVFATHASLRAQLNRAANKGVRVSQWSTERAEGHPALLAVLRAWLATRGLPPLRFLVEPDTLHHLTDRMVFVAERGDAVVGFLVASPIPARNGWLIEQVIRSPVAPNGVVEILIHAAASAMAAANFDYVTLGLAPLSRRAGSRDAAHSSWWLRATLGWVRAHGRRFYDFDGLDAFKAKFRPEEWSPVFAIVNQPRFSPRMLYAIAAAFSGGSPVRLIGKALGRAVRQEGTWLLSRGR
jgi:phosphatidylglycerol lysyltransferase